MSWKNIEYQKTKSFGKLTLDYRLKKPHFSDLITNFPSLDNFQNQISIKSKNLWGNSTQSAVIPSVLSTALSATHFS